MRLTSTRDATSSASYEEAILTGLAPDGGLYQPTETPDLSQVFEAMSPTTPFVDIATTLTCSLIGDELGPETASDLCGEAFSFSPALTTLADRIDLLELYHGPSCAFKDFGASFLAASMSYFLRKRGRRTVILTATSGDTGSAVAEAFAGRDSIEVVVLYPSGRVSPLQEQQLTTVGGNVHALEVSGAFDDCQRMVKEAFLDAALKRELPLTSANSINIGRLLPQSFYYVFASTRLGDDRARTRFCVPSGNFGNLTAGVMAWRWGMPIAGFIAATNANDVVPEYLRTALFSPRASVRTCSNAMDVGNPSNFERLLALFDGDHDRMAQTIAGDTATDRETCDEISTTHAETGRFICPHTAVGILAAKRYLTAHPDERVVCLATAHPAKFGEVIESATGLTPELPDTLAEAMSKPKVATRIGPTLDALSGYLMDELRG